jgi:hypothetical protein
MSSKNRTKQNNSKTIPDKTTVKPHKTEQQQNRTKQRTVKPHKTK